jgi:hypothetical protein
LEKADQLLLLIVDVGEIAIIRRACGPMPSWGSAFPGIKKGRALLRGLFWERNSSD